MDHRQEIYEAISEMLDNPDEHGIYPTTKCYDRLETYCNAISEENQVLTKALQFAQASLDKATTGHDEQT